MSNRLTDKLAPAVAVLGALLILGGCLYFQMGDTWHLRVKANPHEFGVPTSELPCQGAISASINFGRVGIITASAAPEDLGDGAVLRHEKTVRPGQPVTVEAVCTDALGNEVGYSRVEGRVLRPGHNAGAASTYVQPGFVGGSLDYCLDATETRGLPPCVWSRDIVSGI